MTAQIVARPTSRSMFLLTRIKFTIINKSSDCHFVLSVMCVLHIVEPKCSKAIYNHGFLFNTTTTLWCKLEGELWTDFLSSSLVYSSKEEMNGNVFALWFVSHLFSHVTLIICFLYRHAICFPCNVNTSDFLWQTLHPTSNTTPTGWRWNL